MTDRIPILIDCDTGIDDSLALLYAAASPEAEIVAVTCCSGNVEAHQVARNTLAVLELAGRTDVEVALGRTVPLVRPLEITPETHGPQGLGHAELPEPTRPLSDRHAADVITEAARERPGEITLVTLGPMTNLAVALDREPTLPTLLKRLVFMGGAFRVPGNTTPTTEWNIHCDPEAARRVFAAFAASPRHPLGLGLDVTEKARILPEHVVELARRAGSRPDDSIALAHGEHPLVATRSVAANPIVRYVADALRFYMEFHARYDGFYGAFIHDPLALAAALDPSLVTSRAVHVDVDTAGGLADGQTIADWRGLTGKPANIDVAVEAAADEFLRRFIERVGGLAEQRSDVAL
ncbi:MAG: purine nucleosidase [Chloroflexota bacterium]|jgi:purine nucleosidase|nr:purine nucleosidase [Chloroflexota bacterium]